MAVRLCLDVNAWYAYFDTTLRKGTSDTAAGVLVDTVRKSECRFGPVQAVVSHMMLDTLEGVLARTPRLAAFAPEARRRAEILCAGGTMATPPSIVLGGTAANPMLDEEDAHVLNVALTGDADLLVTNNIGDFAGGGRSMLATEELGKDKKGRVDVVFLRHLRAPHGLTIASAFRAAAWLTGGVAPPAGAVPRLVQQEGA